jgi:Gram-negative porin
MKRVALLCMGLVMGAASAAEAQLTMQMSNGWSFTFGGNVNAFLVYEKPTDNSAPTATPGGIVAAGGEGATRIRTGLLPAFAVFDAKGKEGSTDLGVHFGFAPQIQCGTNAAGTAVVHDCFGAQIDMRQVYLTVGGTWGQILAGRELGLFGRQNILTDQTLFGIGATGGQFSGGTTLGRIGFGYIYPQFKAQMTYSTAAGRPFQLSIGLFDPASNGPYAQIELPRVEAEGVYSAGNTKFWFGGLVQNNSTGGVASESATSWGGTGGIRFGSPTFSLTASGYYGSGLGTTLLYTLGNGVGGTIGDDLRTSMGGLGQLTFTPANSKLTVAGSWGISILENSDSEAAFKTKNWLASGGIYYQATKSLKAVGEFNYAVTGDDSDLSDDNKSIAPAFGLMLFF